jgi:uncharacterized protein YgiM (DUF1202 family)
MPFLVRAAIPEQDQRSYRMVIAKEHLLVRRYPRRSDSAILAQLRFGTIVAVVRQQNDWTLVE